jgi:hypothetical protein
MGLASANNSQSFGQSTDKLLRLTGLKADPITHFSRLFIQIWAKLAMNPQGFKGQNSRVLLLISRD